MYVIVVYYTQFLSCNHLHNHNHPQIIHKIRQFNEKNSDGDSAGL